MRTKSRHIIAICAAFAVAVSVAGLANAAGTNSVAPARPVNIAQGLGGTHPGTIPFPTPGI